MTGPEHRGIPIIHPMDTILGPRSPEREQRIKELIDHWQSQGLFPTLFADAEENGTGKNYVQLRNVPFQNIAEARGIFMRVRQRLLTEEDITVGDIAMESDAIWHGEWSLNSLENSIQWMGIDSEYDALLESYRATFDLGRKISEAHEAGQPIPQTELVQFQTELQLFITELEKLYTEKLGVPMVAAQ